MNLSREKHKLFLYWLLLVAGVTVAGIIAWDLGFIHLLVQTDVSRLSSIIAVVFVAATCHAGVTLVRLSRTAELLRQRGMGSEPGSTGPSAPPRRRVPPWLRRNIESLVRLGAITGESARTEGSSLMDLLDRRIKAPVRLGWLLADLLIKLGLLGTVIGFILMLGAVSDAGEIDISDMQNLLAAMGSGMRVALFTTLCGLSLGTLLGFQYYIVERGADDLIGEIAQLVATKSRADTLSLGEPPLHDSSFGD